VITNAIQSIDYFLLEPELGYRDSAVKVTILNRGADAIVSDGKNIPGMVDTWLAHHHTKQ
jgi:hypothetical protein